MPRKQKAHARQLVNFYETDEVKRLQPKYHNPHFSTHGINIPFRAVVCASSGSGKSNLVLNLLQQMNGTFNDVYLFCREKSEPLYEHLENSMKNPRTGKPNPHLHIFEGLEEMNGWNLNTHFEEHGQTLIVIDDMCNEKDQRQVCELYIRGRKLGRGVSLLYMSQSWFLVPRVVRLQSNLIILRRLGSSRDVSMILREVSLGVTIEELLDLYQRCVGDDSILGFLSIHVGSDNPFRKNLNEPIPN